MACLAPAKLPTHCTAPTTTLSGRVVEKGPVPVSQACIFALGPSGPVGQTITGEDGRWTITDLPIEFPFVIGVIPPFDIGLGPCRPEDGPPPVPPAGHSTGDVYQHLGDLADQALLSDPYGWGTARGAQSITNTRSGIDVCLTTDPGTVIPRPSCDAATPTPQPTGPADDADHDHGAGSPPIDSRTRCSGGRRSSLANTGGPSAWLVALAAGLLALGVNALHRSHTRRR